MKEGYLQTKLSELTLKVGELNEEIDKKVDIIKRIETDVDNKLKGKLKLIIESEGKIEGFVNELKDEFIETIKTGLNRLELILNSRLRKATVSNAKLILEEQQSCFDRAEENVKDFSQDVYSNIRILFTEFYGLLDKLNIERNKLPDVDNNYGIRKATVKDITPMVEEALDKLGIKGEGWSAPPAKDQ